MDADVYPCGCTRGLRPRTCPEGRQLWKAVGRAYKLAQREGPWCAYDAALDVALLHLESQVPVRSDVAV